ncbi:hypothetical protein ABH980_003857 [Bradyrhizobium ottawaense]
MGGSSTSMSVRVPVASGVPGVPLAMPPASMIEPVVVPEMIAASLTPLMVIVKVWVTEVSPSETVITKPSVVGAFSALIAALSGTNV